MTQTYLQVFGTYIEYAKRAMSLSMAHDPTAKLR